MFAELQQEVVNDFASSPDIVYRLSGVKDKNDISMCIVSGADSLDTAFYVVNALINFRGGKMKIHTGCELKIPLPLSDVEENKIYMSSSIEEHKKTSDHAKTMWVVKTPCFKFWFGFDIKGLDDIDLNVICSRPRPRVNTIIHQIVLVNKDAIDKSFLKHNMFIDSMEKAKEYYRSKFPFVLNCGVTSMEVMLESDSELELEVYTGSKERAEKCDFVGTIRRCKSSP